MADERRIVIELKLNNTTQKKDKEKSEGDQIVKVLKAIKNPTEAVGEAVFGKNDFLFYTFQQAKNLAKSTLTYYLQRYFNLTENYQAEQDLSNTMSIISHSSDFFSSIIGGAIMGAETTGNIAGAIGGAIVGTGVSITNTIINAQKIWDQQSMKLQTMNMQSSFQRVKLGLIDDGRGTQN